MSKIFGILTAIVLAIAGFVAFKNKAALETEIVNRQTVQEALAKSEERLKKAEGDLAATQKDHEEVRGEIPKAETQKGAQQKANDELTAAKTTKTGEVEANKAKLDQIREKTGSLPNIRDLVGQMSTMIEDTKTVSASVDIANSKLVALTSESNRVDAQVSKQKDQAALVNKGESFPTLRTSISAIYPNWGFVTLSAGNTSGVITNSTLDVVRNDEVIAKLLVTAVERNTASASIIPESVKADTELSVGDRVVPGLSAEPAPAPASAKPAN